jgi:hypothetical protein
MKLILFVYTIVWFSVSSLAQESVKNRFHFTVSLPYINGYHVNGCDTMRNSWGFCGASIGIEYGKPNQSLNLKISASTDLFAPAGAIDIYGEFTFTNAIIVSLTEKRMFYPNLKLKRYQPVRQIDIGYGLNYSHFKWGKYDYYTEFPYDLSSNSSNIGLTGYINFYYLRRFYVGYDYQPTFIFHSGWKNKLEIPAFDVD